MYKNIVKYRKIVFFLNTGKGGKKMAVASLVLGICALVFPFIGLGWLSVIIGVVGVVLGALG